MTVGGLHWVAFPARGGHAQAGRRPALVVLSADASARLPTVLLVPLTTQTDALRFPGTVLVEPDAGNGLRRPSVALVFQHAAVDKQFVEEALGMASPATMNARMPFGKPLMKSQTGPPRPLRTRLAAPRPSPSQT